MPRRTEPAWLALAVLLLAGPLASVASAQEQPRTATRELEVAAQSSDAAARQLIDQLAPETVLTVTATGFPDDSAGTIRQCVTAEQKICRFTLPVRFDERGRAIFQYLVTDRLAARFHDDPCRLASAARCTIEIVSSQNTTVVDVVFVDAAPPPGRISVSPNTGLELGQTVRVELSDFSPGITLRTTVCAVPATHGRRCGAPAPELLLDVGADGTAGGQFVLELTSVGEAGVSCGRRTTCQVVVDSPAPGVRAAPVPLHFRTGPAPDYAPGRVTVGLSAAALLLVFAAWMIRSTDWSPPCEADGASIDEAAFADLDAEAQRFEERVGQGR